MPDASSLNGSRRQVVAALGACWMLGNCFPGSQASSMTDLSSLLPADARVFAHQDESSLLFDQAVIRLKERDAAAGGKGAYSGQRLAAAAGVKDAEIVADLSRQLGSEWQRAAEVATGNASMKIYLWEKAGAKPQRFYALIAYQRALKATDGTVYRPLQTMYPER
ncbi:hypothetical protein [Ottowia sp.]|uniref:hypothetical protein n=1 Tax=Ottowia sp. TaxID=1898956 RepID=UPI0039E4BC89